MKRLVCRILWVALALSTAKADTFYTLPPLPYPRNALEPYISERTLDFHYDKHHQGYLDKLYDLVIQKADLQGISLEALLQKSYNDPELKSVFFAAAQVWNHTFYWQSMKPGGGGQPTGDIVERFDKTFGNYGKFKTQFIEAGVNLFGSGWVWLIEDQGKLRIVATSNADLPLVHGQKALLTCDVWEHAYYLDYQNLRKKYIEEFLDHLVNWDFANQNLAK